MKIIYCMQEEWEQSHIEKHLSNHQVVYLQGAINDHVGFSDPEAEALSIFVNSHVGATELDRFPNLKLIATRSTGFDHIDMDEVKKRGIMVANVPSYGVNTVAEFAFALLLELSRKVAVGNERVKNNSFSQNGLTGFDLAGKTIGIVGCGRIGIHSVKIANGFGMQVQVFDVYQDPKLAEDHHFSYVTLEELLKTSDVINIHVPYNEHTHHLINSQNISLIRRGAYLVNTARGAVIETQALVHALKEGILEGAGLDVLEGEGEDVMTINKELIALPQVIATPHVAFNTKEAVTRILDTTLGNITAFVAAKPTNIVAA